MSERRQHQRVQGPFEGSWDGSGGLAKRIVDVSVEGCFIETMSPPRVGQRLTVSIVLGGQEIELPGEVVYCDSALGFAVRFHDIPEAAARVLREAVSGGTPAE